MAALQLLCLNPFSFWLYAGIIALIMICFSPERQVFFNDVHALFNSEHVDGFTAIGILYLLLPLSIPQIIQTYKKHE